MVTRSTSLRGSLRNSVVLRVVCRSMNWSMLKGDLENAIQHSKRKILIHSNIIEELETDAYTRPKRVDQVVFNEFVT